MNIERIGKYIGLIGAKFLIAALLNIVYSKIAYEFNRPTFNYWVALGVTIIIDYFRQ